LRKVAGKSKTCHTSEVKDLTCKLKNPEGEPTRYREVVPTS
jgi:hypothetical protein